MAKMLAFPKTYTSGDDALVVHFELHVIDTTLRTQLGDHSFEVDVTIPNALSVTNYYRKALETIVDSFSDLWASGIFVLYGDVAIVGWREISKLNQSTFEMLEDFIGTSAGSGLLGEWNWQYNASNVGLHGALSTGNESNHPGIVKFQGAVASDTNMIVYPNNFAMSKTDEIVIIFKIVGTDMSRVFYEIGLQNLTVATTGYTQAIMLMVDNNSATTTANWSVKQIGAVVSTTATTMPALQGKWYEMRLSKTSTTNWRLRISNLTDRTVDQNNVLISISSWSAQSLSPWARYFYYTSGTGAREIWIDHVRWSVSGLTRA